MNQVKELKEQSILFSFIYFRAQLFMFLNKCWLYFKNNYTLPELSNYLYLLGPEWNSKQNVFLLAL